jgi:hypothetical protein
MPNRAGNWVPTVMGRRYDAFVWIDETEALHPLPLEPVSVGAEQATDPWTT